MILDGFPRTNVQVECLKLLVDKMHALRREFFNTPLSIHFRQPTIHIMVLFVDEKESIARQLKRGRETRAHNEEVRPHRRRRLREDRPTDHDEALARRRYRVFKEQTWDALQSLKEIFHYHFINAQGPIEEVEQNILQELEYQSTLELDPRTVDRLRDVPVASEIIVHARQELVKRLDSYELEYGELFAKVVLFIERKMMPIVLRHAISGVAQINTEDAVLDDPLALAMLIDVFSERGYHAVVDIHRIDVPERFDLATGAIKCRVKKGLPHPDPVPGLGNPARLIQRPGAFYSLAATREARAAAAHDGHSRAPESQPARGTTTIPGRATQTRDDPEHSHVSNVLTSSGPQAGGTGWGKSLNGRNKAGVVFTPPGRGEGDA